MTNQQSSTATRKDIVRSLNDELRATKGATGMLVVTHGVQSYGPDFVNEAIAAVSEFEAFEAENDPYEEHDFGCLTLHREELFFKIDYYEPDLTMHSPDKADPAVTTRVLTIMLAGEY